MLEADGAHFLVLTGGMNVQSPWWIFGSPMPVSSMKREDPSFIGRRALDILRLMQPKDLAFRELYFHDHSIQVRAATTLPLLYLGGVTSMAGVDQVLGEGFDAVVLARALLHDPELVNKFAAGTATRSGCTACNECVATMHTPLGTHCVLRPLPDPAENQAIAGT